jgi:hypothetical protein
MFLLDSLLIDGLRFVMDKVATAADAESHDETTLRERLLEAQMRLELGELSEDDFAQIEREVLTELREMRGAQTEGLSLTSKDVHVTGVEATVAPGVDEPDR